MKRLQRYYFYVGIPVLLVLLGTLVFMPEIISTVEGNPHPQINYVIFGLIVAGCAQMLLHVRRINSEGLVLQQFFQLLVRDDNPTGAAELLLTDKNKGKSDVAEVLTLVLGLNNQIVGPLQHAAVESELERFQTRQNRCLLLSQFMAGMMVGLGLLGTFIGLLGALAEIGKLIGSFTLGAGMADPVAAISELVARLTSPMQAMGVAFSASLFGVLGSLIMGVLMVSVRGAAGDLVSMVESRVSLVIDAISSDDAHDGFTSLNRALSELAQHSPILQGLAVALDQSERRVRETLNAVLQLVAGVDSSTQASNQVVELFKQSSQTQNTTLRAVEQVQEDFAKMLTIQADISRRSEQFIDAIARQQSLVEGLMKTSETQQENAHQHQMSLFSEQKALWQQGAITLREQLNAQQRYWDDMLRQNQNALVLERKTSESQHLLQLENMRDQSRLQQDVLDEARQQALEHAQRERNLWREQMVQREQELGRVINSIESQAEAKRQAWLSRSQVWNDAVAQNFKVMEVFMTKLERGGTHQTERLEQFSESIKQVQHSTMKTLVDFSQLMNEVSQTIRQDGQSRTMFTNQFQMQMTEFQTRQEYLLQEIALVLGKIRTG